MFDGGFEMKLKRDFLNTLLLRRATCRVGLSSEILLATRNSWIDFLVAYLFHRTLTIYLYRWCHAFLKSMYPVMETYGSAKKQWGNCGTSLLVSQTERSEKRKNVSRRLVVWYKKREKPKIENQTITSRNHVKLAIFQWRMWRIIFAPN